MEAFFKDIPIFEWDDLDDKTLIIRVHSEGEYKVLCGYDPIENKTYFLADSRL